MKRWLETFSAMLAAGAVLLAVARFERPTKAIPPPMEIPAPAAPAPEELKQVQTPSPNFTLGFEARELVGFMGGVGRLETNISETVDLTNGVRRRRLLLTIDSNDRRSDTITITPEELPMILTALDKLIGLKNLPTKLSKPTLYYRSEDDLVIMIVPEKVDDMSCVHITSKHGDAVVQIVRRQLVDFREMLEKGKVAIEAMGRD